MILYISQSRSGNLPFIQGNMVSFSETLYSMMKIWTVVLFIATDWLLSVGIFSIYTHNLCMCIYTYMCIYKIINLYSYFQLRFRSIGFFKNLTFYLNHISFLLRERKALCFQCHQHDFSFGFCPTLYHKSWLTAQHSENEDHGIWSHHFMGNRWDRMPQS